MKIISFGWLVLSILGATPLSAQASTNVCGSSCGSHSCDHSGAQHVCGPVTPGAVLKSFNPSTGIKIYVCTYRGGYRDDGDVPAYYCCGMTNDSHTHEVEVHVTPTGGGTDTIGVPDANDDFMWD